MLKFLYSFVNMWCVMCAHGCLHSYIIYAICKHYYEYRHIVTMIEWSPVWRMLNSHSHSVNKVHLKSVYMRAQNTFEIWRKKKLALKKERRHKKKCKQTQHTAFIQSDAYSRFEYCLRMQNCLKWRQFMIEYAILWVLFIGKIHPISDIQSHDKIWKMKIQIENLKFSYWKLLR